MIGRALALIAILLAAGLATVALRVAATQEGYKIQGLDLRVRAASRENRRLEARLEETVTARRALLMNEKLNLGLRPPARLEN